MARDRGRSNTYSMSRVSLLFEYPCIRSPFSSRGSQDPESRRVLHVTAFGPLLPSDPHSLGLCTALCRGKKHQCVIARLSRWVRRIRCYQIRSLFRFLRMLSFSLNVSYDASSRSSRRFSSSLEVPCRARDDWGAALLCGE